MRARSRTSARLGDQRESLGDALGRARVVLVIERAQRGGPRFLHGGQFGETPQERAGERGGQIAAAQRQGLREIALEHAAELVGEARALIDRVAPRSDQRREFARGRRI